MPELGRQTIRPIGVNGILRESALDSSLIPQGGIVEAVNFNFDRIGVASVRPGITQIGATMSGIGRTIVALWNASGSALLVANHSGNIWSIPGTDGDLTWTATALSGSIKTRFVDFAGYTLSIPAGSPPSSQAMTQGRFPYRVVNSNSDVPPFRIGQYTANRNASFGEVYKSRVYLAGDSVDPNRLFFSSVINSAGEISWNTLLDYVDINPGEGENITGLKRFLLDLLIFKPNSIYRFRTSGLDPDPMIRIGTRSQESIIEGKRGLYFHHETGFYRYTGGTSPEEISRPIADVVDAITIEQARNISAWKDNDHIYWSVGGDITVGGVKGSTKFKNVVIRYTESSDAWTIYEYAYAIGAGTVFISNSIRSIVVAPNTPLTGGGLNQGFVAEFNKGMVDVTAQGFKPINYRLITKWYSWGGIENRKFIQQMIIESEKGMGMNIAYQVDTEDTNWITLSSDLRDLVMLFDKSTDKFKRIRFKVFGTSRDESPVFSGLDVIKGTNEGLIK